MTKDLVLKKVSKKFGESYAVRGVDLVIKDGEFVTLLGPSGCGKTTTLRMIAGFETITEGSITYNGKVINELTPQQRKFGIVFQSYALFPHMRVDENVAFGLKMQKYPKDKIDARVNELLDIVGLRQHKKKYPAELSGGMQQRVALARALAPNPDVILLDEPLSALDAKIRVKLRAEIKQLQAKLGVTMIYVTHDQEEALSISDRVVVMNQGVVEQVDVPVEIYKKPTSEYVADFVGSNNFCNGVLKNGTLDIIDKAFVFKVDYDSSLESQTITAAIRPERIEVMNNRDSSKLEPGNLLTGELIVFTFLGLIVRLVVKVEDKEINVDMLEKNFTKLKLSRGDQVTLYLPPDGFLIFTNNK